MTGEQGGWSTINVRNQNLLCMCVCMRGCMSLGGCAAGKINSETMAVSAA